MNRLIRLAAVIALGLASLGGVPRAGAQHAGPTSLIVAPPAQARQYDFLVGEWALTARPKIGALARLAHGDIVLTGTWKARRALDSWGVQDEMRLVDESGNPTLLVAATRFYDVREGHWTTTSLDVYRGRQTVSTARRVDAGMQSVAESRDADGKPARTRVTIDVIDENRLVLRQDRSYDDGQTWDEAVLVIEAHRLAQP